MAKGKGTELIAELLPKLVEIRHDLHRHPELGFKEERTRDLVRNWLTTHGWETKIYAKTGLAADLNPGAPLTIALRADMDALPVDENQNLPYHSLHPGCAHKCGHDGHTVILMGVAAVLAQLRPSTDINVRLIFQPAEEGVDQGGAMVMIDEGILEGVDEIYGLHSWPPFPEGEIRVVTGPVMAQVTNFEITLTGKGGHGSQPQATRDPLAAGALLVTALQNIKGRSLGILDPTVISVCSFNAGQAHNIIPGKAKLSGTIRTFSDDAINRILERMQQIVSGTATAMEVEADLKTKKLFPVLNNHAGPVEKIRQAVISLFGADKLNDQGLPLAASEDFARFTKQVPGAYFFIGAGKPDGNTPGCHHPDFDFNDALIEPAMRLFLALAGV